MISRNFIQRHLLSRSALSDLLLPLSLLNSAYQTQRRGNLPPRAWKAPCRVISVGNLTSGGSGKTPFTIFLAGLLRDAGIRTGISHRGYRGTWENTPALISDGNSLLAEVTEAGDEALLIASRLRDIPVVVGKRRGAALSVLLGWQPELQVAILDDAFQHLRIARDLDILCFSAETGLGNGRVIPSGYLRESLGALDPSQIAVIISKQAKSGPNALNGCLANQGLPVFELNYQARAWVNASGEAVAKEQIGGKRLLLVSGIAEPESFERTVRDSGWEYVAHQIYPDHHPFSDPQEISSLQKLVAGKRIDWILCTEKDLAKLSRHPELRPLLLALRIDLACERQNELLALIQERLNLAWA